MQPIGCPETSIRIYHYSMRDNPEEYSSQNCKIVYLVVKVQSFSEAFFNRLALVLDIYSLAHHLCKM